MNEAATQFFFFPLKKEINLSWLFFLLYRDIGNTAFMLISIAPERLTFGCPSSVFLVSSLAFKSNLVLIHDEFQDLHKKHFTWWLTLIRKKCNFQHCLHFVLTCSIISWHILIEKNPLLGAWTWIVINIPIVWLALLSWCVIVLRSDTSIFKYWTWSS